MNKRVKQIVRALFGLLVLGVLLARQNDNVPAVRPMEPLPRTSPGSPSEAEASWPMAAANPARTSWTPEEVRGQLKPTWYRPIEPYISQKVQIIAANGMLYISTARGLYALDADTGAEEWVYPTGLPLGHSPTITNGVAYVGGLDRKIHAINALTGQKLWTFSGGAGFQTNPLVVGGRLHAGNRDGYFYALDTQTGQLVWKFKTDGPILYSAAYKDGIVYFASNDGHAYALNAQTGAQVWKSAKLPGAGFHSWWPVVHQDVVVFSGSTNYRTQVRPGPRYNLQQLDLIDVYPDHATEPKGTLVGPRDADGWIDATRITQYFEQKPWRRTYFVLDRATGQEITYDFDTDVEPEYAPILWAGTHSGNRYPPVVGVDGILYQFNNYLSDPYIPWGQVLGWELGQNALSTPSADWNATDEPLGYAAGGNVIYWKHFALEAGAFDISIPPTFNASGHPVHDPEREWKYYSNYEIYSMCPGLDEAYQGYFTYGGRNGIYGYCCGDMGPPIPYRGKVYMLQANAVIAWAPSSQAPSQPTALPMARTLTAPPAGEVLLGVEQLKSQLAAEIEKILVAGHLRPGYFSMGIFDLPSSHMWGDKLLDYWHNPADTLYTLIRTLPHLSPDLQQRTKAYLQSEFAAYPPYSYTHIGWKEGAGREATDLPPEVENDRVNLPPNNRNWDGWDKWTFDPYTFYGMWKYAQVFGGAKDIFDQSKHELDPVPADSVLAEMPHVHNAYIAGYLGYLELEKLAGYPESSHVQAELDRLLTLRASTFSKDSLYTGTDIWGEPFSPDYYRTLNIARNFMYLTPELAQYLHDNALGKVQEAVSEYNRIAPYWFVSKAEEHPFEGVFQPLYDTHGMFQAKALILKESPQELEKYLDVPAFERGDLFYIQNLVALLELEVQMSIYLPLILKGAAKQTVSLPPFRRANAPYFSGDVRFSETAIFWFGQVTPTENHVDVRVGYNDSKLWVRPGVFDRRLWYDSSPSRDTLTDWDAATLYLDMDGNTGDVPDADAYRFEGQLNWWEKPRTRWEAVYRGNGTSWVTATIPFTTDSGWAGDAPNNDNDDRGWAIAFHIPFTSLGLSGPPPQGTIWGLALVLHDRDDEGGRLASAGTPIADKTWPEDMHPNHPASWGQLAFGVPVYTPITAIPGGTITIRHKLNGSTVVDGMVGGGTTCGGGLDYWTQWGEENYAGREQFNIQNQAAVSDWLCCSKYYVAFPLDTIPSNKVIISATLTLYQFGHAGEGWPEGPQLAYIQVLTIGEDWNESTLTWNNAPLARENISGTWTGPVYGCGTTVPWPCFPRTWDVSRAVAQAYVDGQPLRLVLFSADAPLNAGKYFTSSDTGDWNEKGRPTLVVAWGEPLATPVWLPQILR